MTIENHHKHTHCVTCGTILQGEYCSKCGEKTLVPEKDFSLIYFSGQAIEGITDLNSKVLKTFWFLFTKPGFLTLEYLKGRRSLYVKPVQLFIVSSLILYFVFPFMTLFFSNIPSMEHGYQSGDRSLNIFNYDIATKVKQKMDEKKMTADQIEMETRKEASDKSKAFLFIIIPFWGFIIYLLYRKSFNFYVPHLIFAVQTFSFFILYQMIIQPAVAFLWELSEIAELTIIRTGFFIYLFFAVKRVYNSKWISTLIKSLCMLISFYAMFFV